MTIPNEINRITNMSLGMANSKKPTEQESVSARINRMSTLQLATGGDDHYHHGLFNGLRMAMSLVDDFGKDETVSYHDYLLLKKQARILSSIEVNDD